MVAYVRSNFSITGAEILAWARRLAGDRQLPPWLQRVEAEHTRNERRADEKLLDRFVWVRTDADGAKAEAVGFDAIFEKEEEILVSELEAERTPEVARRYMAENQNSFTRLENLQRKKDQWNPRKRGIYWKKIVEGTRERDRDFVKVMKEANNKRINRESLKDTLTKYTMRKATSVMSRLTVGWNWDPRMDGLRLLFARWL